MEQLMEQMNKIHQQKEAEVQRWRAICSDQEAMISAAKTAVGMDKLQADYGVLKDANDKLQKRIDQLTKEKKLIENQSQRKIDELTRQLNTRVEQNTSTRWDKSSTEKFSKNSSIDLTIASVPSTFNSSPAHSLTQLANRPSKIRVAPLELLQDANRDIKRNRSFD